MALGEVALRDLMKRIYLLQIGRAQFSLTDLPEVLKASAKDSKKIVRGLLRRGLLESVNRGDGTRPADPAYRISKSGRKVITVVLTGGVFDLIHVGHLAALEEARQLGDLLIAVVARDVTVEKFKGRKPIFSQEERRTLVESLKPVDKAILGYEDAETYGYERIIDDVTPDIIALGYDQRSLAGAVKEILARRGLKVRLVNLSEYKQGSYASSTEIKRRLAGSVV